MTISWQGVLVTGVIVFMAWTYMRQRAHMMRLHRENAALRIAQTVREEGHEKLILVKTPRTRWLDFSANPFDGVYDPIMKGYLFPRASGARLFARHGRNLFPIQLGHRKDFDAEFLVHCHTDWTYRNIGFKKSTY